MFCLLLDSVRVRNNLTEHNLVLNQKRTGPQKHDFTHYPAAACIFKSSFVIPHNDKMLAALLLFFAGEFVTSTVETAAVAAALFII